MNNLNQSNKNVKIILYSFMLKLTQTNSNIGLRGKKPKFSFSLQNYQPKAQTQEEMKRVDLQLTPHYCLLDLHASYSMFPCTSLQRSFLLSLSLALGHFKHTHTQISHKFSLEYSRTHPSSPLKNLENQEAFKRVFPQTLHLR